MTIWLSKPRKIFQRIAIDAIWRSLVFDRHLNKWPRAKPGEVIMKMKPEERAELAKLTSEEIKNDGFHKPTVG